MVPGHVRCMLPGKFRTQWTVGRLLPLWCGNIRRRRPIRRWSAGWILGNPLPNWRCRCWPLGIKRLCTNWSLVKLLPRLHCHSRRLARLRLHCQVRGKPSPFLFKPGFVPRCPLVLRHNVTMRWGSPLDSVISGRSVAHCLPEEFTMGAVGFADEVALPIRWLCLHGACAAVCSRGRTGRRIASVTRAGQPTVWCPAGTRVSSDLRSSLLSDLHGVGPGPVY